MKKVLAFVAVFVFLTLPLSASAIWTPGDPLVPREIINANPQDVQACHLVQLFDNLVQFAIYIAVFIATLMFVYAGILYVTASARAENLNQAKGIFGKVFMGFLFVLGAWIIINIVMSVFVVEKTRPWNEVVCTSASFQPPQSSSGLDSGIAGDPDAVALEDQKRDRVTSQGVRVNNEYACPVGVTRGCTTLAGTDDETLDYVVDIKEACDAASGSQCTVVITGGSEGGHAGGTRPGSHGGGDKVDLRLSGDTGLPSFIEKQVADGKFEEVENPTFGRRQWVDTATGAVWTDEDDHYDVCVSNCSAPAARGS